jgi:radical SAM superfamily enzyme YgiQ (UPF0313 family)
MPQGLMLLASIAIQEGHETAIMDLNYQRPVPTWRDVAKQMSVEKWDVIAIGGLSSMYKDIIKVLKISRKLNPDALIVCGGGFITYMPDKIMEFCPEIDVAGIGEGEDLFRDVLKTKEGNENWKTVRGICYREDGQTLFTEPRPLIQNLDNLPYPAYELVDVESYFKYSASLWAGPGIWQSKRRMNMVTERGCPRQCTFCTHNGMNRWDQQAILGKERLRLLDKEAGFQAVVRFFSPKYVVDHALYLYDKYQIDYLCLMDENNTASPGRMHEFCDLWIKEGLHKKVRLATGGDAPSINAALVKHMKEANFSIIAIGGESGSDRVLLKDIGKGVTRAHNQKAIELLQQGDITPSMTFMVGNPNEDINDVLETVDFFIKNDAIVDPFICTPYPGTKIFYDNQDFILEQYDERLALLKQLPNPNIPEETIRKWKDEALQKFLLSLNNATDYSCTVSKKFDYADLLAIKHFMHEHNTDKLLKLAHMRGWPHDKKWENICPVCKAEKEIALTATF